jgi:hypothetical protein
MGNVVSCRQADLNSHFIYPTPINLQYFVTFRLMLHTPAIYISDNSSQEGLDIPSNILKVEKESIMTEQTHLLTQLHMRHIPIPTQPQRLSDLPLLPRREEDITRNTHDQRRCIAQRSKTMNQIIWRPT